jgi:hypothetical protein
LGRRSGPEVAIFSLVRRESAVSRWTTSRVSVGRGAKPPFEGLVLDPATLYIDASEADGEAAISRPLYFHSGTDLLE